MLAETSRAHKANLNSVDQYTGSEPAEVSAVVARRLGVLDGVGLTGPRSSAERVRRLTRTGGQELHVTRLAAVVEVHVTGVDDAAGVACAARPRLTVQPGGPDKKTPAACDAAGDSLMRVLRASKA